MLTFHSGSAPAPRRRAFTLVELLVVVAIIALLISILLPSLSQARAMARDMKCRSILKQLGMAQHMFAEASDGYFVNCCREGAGQPKGGGVNWQTNRKFLSMLAQRGYDDIASGTKVSQRGLFCPSQPDKYIDPAKGETYAGDWRNIFLYRGWGYSLNDAGLSNWLPGWSVHRDSVPYPSEKIQHLDNNDKNSYYWGVDPRVYWDVSGELSDWEGGQWGVTAYRHQKSANLLHFDTHVSSYSRKQSIEDHETDVPGYENLAQQKWYIYGD